MKNQHRKDIEQFCRDFLKGRNRQIDIRTLNLRQETFDGSFKIISGKLFDTRPADRNYIISLLGFALTLHEYHLSYHYS